MDGTNEERRFQGEQVPRRAELDPDRPHLGDRRAAAALLLLIAWRDDDGHADTDAIRQAVAMIDPADLGPVLLSVLNEHDRTAADDDDELALLGEIVRGLHNWPHHH